MRHARRDFGCLDCILKDIIIENIKNERRLEQVDRLSANDRPRPAALQKGNEEQLSDFNHATVLPVTGLSTIPALYFLRVVDSVHRRGGAFAVRRA